LKKLIKPKCRVSTLGGERPKIVGKIGKKREENYEVLRKTAV